MKMRQTTRRILSLTAAMAAVSVTHAALTVPGATGADGVFAPSQNVTVDLSLAQTATWDSPPPWAGGGVYDPEKWAVVFKYAAVSIPAGVTVTFKNHATRAPVVWLVTGDVTIAGSLILDGRGGKDSEAGQFLLQEPGPGGFRGGSAATGTSGARLGVSGAGFGPGGGWRSNNYGGGGSHATLAGQWENETPPPRYGNAQILPLIGGSGSAGSGHNRIWGNGSGGGGAILIAAQGRIQISGLIRADGGVAEVSGGGAGGAIRLIANRLEGSGTVQALGAPGHWINFNSYLETNGGDGRIRLEAVDYLGSLKVAPPTQIVPPTTPALLWPPDTAPALTVLSVGGAQAPTDPKSALGPEPADVTLPAAGSQEVLIQARNLPPIAGVKLRITPRSGQQSIVPAAFVSGDFSQSIWKADANLSAGFAALQAYAVIP